MIYIKQYAHIFPSCNKNPSNLFPTLLPNYRSSCSFHVHTDKVVTTCNKKSLILVLKSHAVLDSGWNSVQLLLPCFLVKSSRINGYFLSFEPHRLASLIALHWTLPTCIQHHMIYYCVYWQNKDNIFLESLLWAQHFSVAKIVSGNRV